MTDLIKKLNYKAHKSIGIFEAPEEFKGPIADFKELGEVYTDVTAAKTLDFVLAFVTTEAAVKKLSGQIVPKLSDDAPLWFVYPKKTSKKYSSEISRDNGWEALGALGFETVRLVAVDNDWSALRFRKLEKIKNLQRNPSWRLT